MARHTQDQDARALGEALAQLRRDAGLSQAEAGAAVGMTSQGWGLYESGRRSGLFRPEVQRKLTAAVGASPEALALARVATSDTPALETANGFNSPARDWRPAPAITRSPALETLQLSDDELAPWAASGVILEFDPGRWPRRDQGCVIDMADGRRLVRLYDRAEADTLFVRGGTGGISAIEALDRSAVRRVCAVLNRREA